jgi:hypothetical protein
LRGTFSVSDPPVSIAILHPPPLRIAFPAVERLAVEDRHGCGVNGKGHEEEWEADSE